MWGLKKTTSTPSKSLGIYPFFYALACLFLLCFITWLPQSGFYLEKKDTLIYLAHETALSAGLRLEEVYVQGRNRSTQKELFEAVNVIKGMPITAIDIQAIRERIQRLPWVKSVKIERRLPHFLYIDLTERTPIAVYQNKGKYVPVDDQGQLVETTVSSLNKMPLLVGAGAFGQAPSLIEILAQEPELNERVKACVRIGKRRWDILLDDIKNPITIRLPEKDPAFAWTRLARLARTEGLLKRKITMIDLRLPDRLFVRLEDENKKLIKK